MWHEIFNQLKSDLIKINLVVYLHVAELFIKTSHWLKNLKRRNSFFIVSSDALYRLWIFQQIEWKSELYHSMARANVNNSVWLVTNTPTASKYIPKWTKIYINWNPPFLTQIYLVKVPLNVNIVKQDLLHKISFWKFYEVRYERGDFNWCWFWSS